MSEPGSAPPADSTSSQSAYTSRLQAAIGLANIPVLLGVLTQLTGDTQWVEPPYLPGRSTGIDDNDSGGLDPQLQAEVRNAAVAAIIGWHEGAPAAIPLPSDDLALKILGVAMGEPIPSEYAGMLATELNPDNAWEAAAGTVAQAPPGSRVLVIGAGIGGICAAERLQRAGIPFEVVEQSDTVGGVWQENRYPGAGVDVPSHLYSFSFAPNDWKQHFALREEIAEYLERVVDDLEIRERVRFNTRVISAIYNETSQRWLVELETANAEREVLSVNILIAAVGIFNPPKWPDIPGLASFQGPMVHTARWPAGLELDGKRVAVIGNGASAMQVVPEIAPSVGHLTIFQRSPHWVMPFARFRQEIPEDMRWLFRHVPFYRLWYRLRLVWLFNDKVHSSLIRDADWEHPSRAMNSRNDRYRVFLTKYLHEELGERSDLVQAQLPDYPVYGKRILLDNGWFKTLRRPNVELVTARVARIVSDGLVDDEGRFHPADAVIVATGFDVTKFLSSFTLLGRGGRAIPEPGHEDNLQAYLGVAIPGAPNFFCLYGPNTQAGHGGSIVYTLERQTNYIISLIRQMFDGGLSEVECRPEVCAEYNAQLDALHNEMVWVHPGVSNYYRNSKGRVVVNSPFRNVDWWHMSKIADLDDYATSPSLTTNGAIGRARSKSSAQG